MTERYRYITITLVAALVANLGILIAMGPARPVESDSIYYAEIARNLATGKGYINTRSPWPTAPAMDRLPGWTGVIAAAMIVTGAEVPSPLLMRVVNAILNIAAAVLVAYLTWRVTSSHLAGGIAGTGYAFYLPALGFMDMALSETGFVCLLTGAALLLLNGRYITGALLLGFGCYFRGNMILLPPFLAAYLWFAARQKLPAVVLALAAFSLAPGAWITRNAVSIPGCFPMMTSAAGEVFRGALNDATAGTWRHWGSWIFPNELPGEPQFQAVTATRNQCEVSKYYQARGFQWARENWTKLPGLMLGRLVRAYLPFTLVFEIPTLAGFACRTAVLLALLLGWRSWRVAVDVRYQHIMAMLFGLSLTTTLLMVAGTRHTFWLEVMAIPLCAAGIAAWWNQRQVSGSRAGTV